LQAMLIETLDPKRHNRADFDCGVQELNRYLQEFANQDQKRGLAKTYVLVDGTRIRGYYSLTAHSVTRKNLPPDIRTGVYNDIPFLLLGRLAVDRAFQGKGYGDAMMYHAFKTTKNLAERLGIFGMIVDAKDEKAVAFYQRFGFRSIEGNKNRLVLPITSFSV
jgi:ribosomal protein S18 acetylase RimI-like enzyme